MLRVITAFFFLGLPFFLQASVLEFNVKEGRKFILTGVEANFIFTGVNTLATGPQLRIQMDAVADAEYQVEENDQGIRVSRKATAANLSDEKKLKAKIEVTGKSIPIEVHLQEGNITITKNMKDLFLHLQKGRITVKENQAVVVAHAQKGEISIVEHKGKVIVDNLQAQMSLKDIVGDVDLQSYQGDSVLENLKGNIVLHSTNGSVKINKGSGSLQFEAGKGSFSSQGFQGRIEGQTTEGNVQVQLPAGEDLNLKSVSGKLSVMTVPNSGALVNAIAIDGEIYGPTHLKVFKDGSQKTLKGRLKGENSESTISLRTQDGQIVIK